MTDAERAAELRLFIAWLSGQGVRLVGPAPLAGRTPEQWVVAYLRALRQRRAPP